MFVRQSTLRSKQYRFTASMTRRSTAGDKTMFLSHSHRDRQLAMGLAAFLREYGVTLYIDWLDQSMPDHTNGETARRIKDRIEASDLFLFLATENSKASRWCPWELGFADGRCGVERVLIVPTMSDSGHRYGNEYLDLYPRLERDALGMLERIWPNGQASELRSFASTL
jgi:hypothetical protein